MSPTSGITNFTVDAETIISASLRKCGVGLRGETLSAEDIQESREALNFMIGAWMRTGLRLWKTIEVTLFLETSKQFYVLGPNGDKATADTVFETTLAVGAAAAATTISLASVVGLNDSDVIGIVLDGGTIHWTTVDVAATTTIASGLASAAASGNTIYAFASLTPRPNKVLEARYRYEGGETFPLTVSSRKDDFSYVMTSNGPTISVHYDSKIVDGVLRIKPPSHTSLRQIVLLVQLPIEIFSDIVNLADFPVEWYKALVWNLAVELAPEHGIGSSELDDLVLLASKAYTEANDSDTETEATYFEPIVEEEY